MDENGTPKLTVAEMQAEYEYRCIVGAEEIAGIVFSHPDPIFTPDTVDVVRRNKALADIIYECGLPTDPAAYTLSFINEIRAAFSHQRTAADAGQRALFDGSAE